MPLVPRRASVLATSLTLMPAVALAHPQHDVFATVANGLFHPLTGIDHVLAMLAVGIWAGRSGKSAQWMVPLLFVLAMVGGACVGALGLGMPAVEPMIAASVVVLGALIATGVRISAAVSAGIVTVFAIFHGHAHAIEAPGGSMLAYGVGFVCATLLLHAIGVVAGRSITARPRIATVGGSAIAAAGLVLLIQ